MTDKRTQVKVYYFIAGYLANNLQFNKEKNKIRNTRLGTMKFRKHLRNISGSNR